MSRLVFWDGGLGGAAEAAVATAVTLGLRYPRRLLMFNEGSAGSGLEEGFRQTLHLHDEACDKESLPEHGLDALLRLQSSGRLTRSNLADYTVPLLRGRLDLVCGTRIGESAWKDADPKGVADVLAIADQSYDNLVLHAQGKRLIEVLQNRQDSDIFVAVLPHRLGIIDEWYANLTAGLGETKAKWAAVISPYDPQSRYGLTNLKRRYSSELRMIGIPHHTEFADAWNDRRILSYFRKQPLWPKRGGARELLLKGYRELGDTLMELASDAGLKEKGA